jgi:hypothetical protein
MSWHHIPKDDAWKQAHLAMLAKLGKRAWLHCDGCRHSNEQRRGADDLRRVLSRFRFSRLSDMITRSTTCGGRYVAVGPHSMRRSLTLLAALAIVAMTLAVGLVAPAAQVERAPLTGKANRTLVGLLVFSSDGKQLGKVLAEGIDEDDQRVLVAEFERPLGLGSHIVAMPTYMFVRKSNQIILTITAKEVAERLPKRMLPD